MAKTDELKGEIDKLKEQVSALGKHVNKNPKLIWEAAFNESIRIVYEDYKSAARGITRGFKTLAGPGVIREFEGSRFVIIAFKDSNEVTLFDNSVIEEINLDPEGGSTEDEQSNDQQSE